MPAFWDQSQMVQWWALSPESKMTHKFHSPPHPLLTVAHPYSGCHWLGYYAHKKQCIFRALLNSANLAAHWHIWQIWAFQSSSLPSRGVLGLNYLTFGTALQNWGERRGGGGSAGTLKQRLRIEAGGAWWREHSQLARTTRAAAEKAADPWGWAEERGRASSRDNPSCDTCGRIETSICWCEKEALRLLKLAMICCLVPFEILDALILFACKIPPECWQ